MVHAAMKLIWAQKWNQLPVAKIKEKRDLDEVRLWQITYQLTNHKFRF